MFQTRVETTLETTLQVSSEPWAPAKAPLLTKAAPRDCRSLHPPKKLRALQETSQNTIHGRTVYLPT